MDKLNIGKLNDLVELSDMLEDSSGPNTPVGRMFCDSILGDTLKKGEFMKIEKGEQSTLTKIDAAELAQIEESDPEHLKPKKKIKRYVKK